MADQGGVGKLQGQTLGVPAQRGPEATAARPSRRIGGGANQGAGRREAPNAGGRQLINLDGKMLNRAAPRGTYLNILV